MSTMRMRRKEKAAASPSAPPPPPTLKEKYATTIGEATVATFRNKRYFAKNFRKIMITMFTHGGNPIIVLPLLPHISKMALAFDDRFGDGLAHTVKKTLLKTDFHPYKTMEHIGVEIVTAAQDVVDASIGDLIDDIEYYQKSMIPMNISLNTTDHVARAINQAAMSFYTDYPDTFFYGYEDPSRTFIDVFTDDFFQEYLERHTMAEKTHRDIENEPGF